MVFSSFTFIFGFLPPVIFIFYFLQRFEKPKLTSLCLLLASIAFYLFWQPQDLIPLFLSILINYLLFILMQKSVQKRIILISGIVFNIIFLAYYKYSGIFGLTPKSGEIPLGISFYTFTQIAFLVDNYREKLSQNEPLNYALFVSYFPHLVCGPILSFKDLYPQLTNVKKFKISKENFAFFVFYFSFGLFKKVWLADPFGEYVAKIFDSTASISYDWRTSVCATLAYSVQLYFDFSSYSDMAVGLSQLFGLKIPHNFNSPYQATSIIDFWRRWHISLSNFLKNYVYIPLGGNQVSSWIRYRNLILVMVLGGIWHGGAWTFILWGVFHGILLGVNHYFREIKGKTPQSRSIPIQTFLTLFKIFGTFALVNLGWILFRAPSLEKAAKLYQSIFFLGGSEVIELGKALNLRLFIALGIAFFIPETHALWEKLSSKKSDYGVAWPKILINQKYALLGILCGLIMAFGILSLNKPQTFLYSGF